MAARLGVQGMENPILGERREPGLRVRDVVYVAIAHER
jgi:hypothetical protein